MPEFDKLSLEDLYGGQTAETYSTFSRRSRLDPRSTVTVKRPMPWFDGRAYSTFNDAMAYLSGTECTLVVSTALTVSSSVTVPSTLSLEFIGGGSLSVSAGVTLTINGTVKYASWPIFTGSGTVSFGASATVAGPPYVKATTGDPTGYPGLILINTADRYIKMYADGDWRDLNTW